jgi:hypothetical protein
MKIIFEEIKEDLVNDEQLPAEEIINIENQDIGELPDNSNVNEDDVSDIQSAFENILTENEVEFSEDNRVLDTSSNLLELAEKINSEAETISVESIELIGKMAVTGTNLNYKAFICLEHFENQNKELALEGIGERLKSVITNILSGSSELLKSFIPTLKSFLTVFSFKKGKVKDLISVVSKLDNNSLLKYTGRSSKYFYYGDNGSLVSSIEEYIKKLNETTTFFSAVNSTSVDYTKGRFLTKAKTYFTIITPGMSGNKNFLELYDSLLDELLIPLSKVANKSKVTKEINGKKFTEYTSDSYLGQWTLKVKIADIYRPKNKDEVSNAIKSTIGVVPLNTASFKSTNNFSSSSAINFDITKKELLSLLQNTEKLIDETIKHINLNIKWNIGYSQQIGKLLTSSFIPPFLVYNAITQLHAGVRIVRLGSYLTSTLLGNCFSAINGLVSTNLKIVKAALG